MASNDRILVSVEDMNAAISKYQNACTTVAGAFTNVSKAFEHIARSFAGPAAATLVEKLTLLGGNIRSAQNAINFIIDGLKKTMDQMEQAENANKSDFGSKDVGTAAPKYLS